MDRVGGLWPSIWRSGLRIGQNPAGHCNKTDIGGLTKRVVFS